jgi:hypothetical protein
MWNKCQSNGMTCTFRSVLIKRFRMKNLIVSLLLASAATASAVDFKSQVLPILRVKCFECHSVAKGKTKGDVALDSDEKIKEIMGAGQSIIPGDPKKSTFYISLTLPDDEDDVMPPKGKNRLNPAELALVEGWIKEGANLTGGGAAPATAAAPAAAPAMAGGEAAPQSWTNSEGKVIEAIFMGLQGDGVLLKIPSTGVTHIVPLAKLSAESQAQAKAAK